MDVQPRSHLIMVAIEAALRAQPLCRGVLTTTYATPDGREARKRCAAGALLAACGVSDDALEDYDEKGQGWCDYTGFLYEENREQLAEKFGIVNEEELATIINENDLTVIGVDPEADLVKLLSSIACSLVY